MLGLGLTVDMDTRLQKKKILKHQDRRLYIIYSHFEHWHTTEECLQPSPLFPSSPMTGPSSTLRLPLSNLLMTRLDKKSAYRDQHSSEWCSDNNLNLKFSNTKGLIVYLSRSNHREHSAFYLHREEAQRVESLKFLGMHISADLTWTTHISHLVGKAKYRLYFLRMWRHAHFPHHLLTNFYWSARESLLTCCCTV